MLTLSEFRHIHHPSGVKMLANLFGVESGYVSTYSKSAIGLIVPQYQWTLILPRTRNVFGFVSLIEK